MAWVLTFRSALFDPATEPPNPVNPIAGHSVLAWLRPALLAAGYACDEPAPEDWGWYVGARGTDGAAYLVGASGEPGSAGDVAAETEWVVQVHPTRSLGQRLRGLGRLTADDPLSAAIAAHAAAEPRVHVLSAGLDDA